MTLAEHLATRVESQLAAALLAVARAAVQIAEAIRETGVSGHGAIGTENASGDHQIALDVLSDEILFAELDHSGAVSFAASEETSIGKQLSGHGYAAAFDPLDGSSLADVNLSIGTIIGLWPGETLIGRTGREQAAAGYVVYGPRTTFVIATHGIVTEYTLQKNEWYVTKETLTIGEGKMFAPGNLRAAGDNPAYARLVEYWMREKYTLRYSGGMVPDIHQILVKQKGVFAYPGSPTAKAKLRLLYECAPLAYVVETAGGASTDGKMSILDLAAATYDHTTPICLGSRAEVARFIEYGAAQ